MGRWGSGGMAVARGGGEGRGGGGGRIVGNDGGGVARINTGWEFARMNMGC